MGNSNSDMLISFVSNKLENIGGQSKMDNPEKLVHKTKKKKNRTQYVIDTTMRKQTLMT